MEWVIRHKRTRLVVFAIWIHKSAAFIQWHDHIWWIKRFG